MQTAGVAATPSERKPSGASLAPASPTSEDQRAGAALDDAYGPVCASRFALFHALACLGAGIWGAVLGFLSTGLAGEMGNAAHAGTAAAWVMASLGWIYSALSLRFHNRGALAFVAALGVTGMLLPCLRLEAAAGAGRGAAQVHRWLGPTLLYWGLLALAVTVVAGARWWGLRFQAPGGAARGRGWGIAGAVYVAALLVTAFIAWPAHVRALGQAAVADLEARVALAVRPAPPGQRPRLVLGAASDVILGRTFTQWPGSAESGAARFAGAMAELEAVRATGASAVLVGAAGDALLTGSEVEAEYAARYVTKVRELGLKLVLADVDTPWRPTSAPPAFDPARPRETPPPPDPWVEFKKRHQQRVLDYLERFAPEVYVLSAPPLAYYRSGEIPVWFDARRSAGDWVAYLRNLSTLVKSRSPGTATAVALQPWVPEEGGTELMPRSSSLYSQFMLMREVDIIGFEVSSQAQLESCERMFTRYGRPSRTGRSAWVLRTFRGWAATQDRDLDADARWLAGLSAWALTRDVEAVFARPNGTFIPGGTLGDLEDGRLAGKWEGAGRVLSPTGQRWAELVRNQGRPWTNPLLSSRKPEEETPVIELKEGPRERPERPITPPP